MTLIRVYSDIHNEFIRGKEWKPLELETDKDTVLVLAGDIDNAKHLIGWIDSFADRFLGVVYVMGNHEIWNHNIDKVYTKYVSEKENVHLLQNSKVTIGDTEFLGGTLWTDMDREDPYTVYAAKSSMTPDFKKIRQLDSYRAWTSARWLHENKVTKQFLKENIVAEKKQVVVTHHAPDFACAEGNECAGNGFDAYYYNNDLQDAICDAGFWVFGHTHHVFDKVLGTGRVYSNPRGYPVAAHRVDEFMEDQVIEI